MAVAAPRSRSGEAWTVTRRHLESRRGTECRRTDDTAPSLLYVHADGCTQGPDTSPSGDTRTEASAAVDPSGRFHVQYNSNKSCSAVVRIDVAHEENQHDSRKPTTHNLPWVFAVIDCHPATLKCDFSVHKGWRMTPSSPSPALLRPSIAAWPDPEAARSRVTRGTGALHGLLHHWLNALTYKCTLWFDAKGWWSLLSARHQTRVCTHSPL